MSEGVRRVAAGEGKANEGAHADARTFGKQKFWSDLPQQFDTQTFLKSASTLAIAPKTAEKYITAWCKAGRLIRVSQGNYSKML